MESRVSDTHSSPVRAGTPQKVLHTTSYYIIPTISILCFFFRLIKRSVTLIWECGIKVKYTWKATEHLSISFPECCSWLTHALSTLTPSLLMLRACSPQTCIASWLIAYSCWQPPVIPASSKHTAYLSLPINNDSLSFRWAKSLGTKQWYISHEPQTEHTTIQEATHKPEGNDDMLFNRIQSLIHVTVWEINNKLWTGSNTLLCPFTQLLYFFIKLN